MQISLALNIPGSMLRLGFRDLSRDNLQTEDGFNILLEDGSFLLLE